MLIVTIILLFQGCASVYTFPTVARPGDTVSLMVGGSEDARKETVSVTFTDSGGIPRDLKAEGLVRSVFNLRADGRAYGNFYDTPFSDVDNSWLVGAHEPLQTVLLVDIPSDALDGPATVKVDTNTSDDSSGVSRPFTISLEILPLSGSPTLFTRKDWSNLPVNVDLQTLEPAPYAKISFGKGGLNGGLGTKKIAAASLIVDFDETVVNAGDLYIYSPQTTSRGDIMSPDLPYGDKQHTVIWHQDGTQLFIDVIAPYSVLGKYLQLYIMHPRGVAGNPNFVLSSVKIYDLDGNDISSIIGGSPMLSYHP